jgi:hypothetical protein
VYVTLTPLHRLPLLGEPVVLLIYSYDPRAGAGDVNEKRFDHLPPLGA